MHDNTIEKYDLSKIEKDVLKAIAQNGIDGYNNLEKYKRTEKKAAVYSLRNKGLITLCDSVPGCDFWIINISEEGKDLMEISPKLRYRQIKKFFNKQTSMRMRSKKVLFSINVFLKSIISILNK